MYVSYNRDPEICLLYRGVHYRGVSIKQGFTVHFYNTIQVQVCTCTYMYVGVFALCTCIYLFGLSSSTGTPNFYTCTSV